MSLNGTESLRFNASVVDHSTAALSKVSSADEYYHIFMLGLRQSQGLTDLGSIKMDVLLCLVTIFILMYICICRGVKGTGK